MDLQTLRIRLIEQAASREQLPVKLQNEKKQIWNKIK